MNDYAGFLARKSALPPAAGMRVEDVPPLPPAMKPFQTACVRWALRRGRAALFENTGLGKTVQLLAWARAVCDHAQGRVLVLCPLAVAEQMRGEAEKFGVNGVAYTPDGTRASSDIVLTNYERFERFDPGDYVGVVLDESSLLKSQDGKTRAALTDAFAETPWKLCCTATPAPNDYAELGQHSEFLGVMPAKEMLATFFVHDGGIRADADDGKGARSSNGWRLKRHAEAAFWRWLATWAVVIRSPADLGFDGAEYELPPLHYHQVTVPSEVRSGSLLAGEASTLSERLRARRDTVETRVRAIADIVAREPKEPWVVWCHLNAEADLSERLLPYAAQVAGKDAVDTKVARLMGFKTGRPLHLVSKPSIAGHGMHWAHCSRVAFVGLSDSFEELYQAIRRCWRFGQGRPVDVYLVAAEEEGAVVANLRRKEAEFERMLDAMAGHMRDIMRAEVLGAGRTRTEYDPKQPMEIPEWLSTESLTT